MIVVNMYGLHRYVTDTLDGLTFEPEEKLLLKVHLSCIVQFKPRVLFPSLVLVSWPALVSLLALLSSPGQEEARVPFFSA